MNANEYTLVFTPRYGVEADTFTLTGSMRRLAFELVRILEGLKLSESRWRIHEHEETGALSITKDESPIYLINNPTMLHDIAFAWCSLDGKHTVQMFDASPANIDKANNLRKVNQ